jgi:hypothetical protein
MRSQSLRGAEKVRDDETSSPTREVRAAAIAVVSDMRRWQAIPMEELFRNELDQIRVRSLLRQLITVTAAHTEGQIRALADAIRKLQRSSGCH